jgi:hypothetical protein
MVEEARTRSAEGVDDATMRTGYLRSLFARQPQGQAFGGNQAAYISGMGAQTANLATAQAGAELQIGQAEEATKREARGTLAQLFSEQKKLQATQEAAIEENKMVAEAEKNRRTYETVGALAGFGVAALGGAPAIGVGVGKGFDYLKSMFGGKVAAQAPAVVGGMTQTNAIPNPFTQADLPVGVKTDETAKADTDTPVMNDPVIGGDSGKKPNPPAIDPMIDETPEIDNTTFNFGQTEDKWLALKNYGYTDEDIDIFKQLKDEEWLDGFLQTLPKQETKPDVVRQVFGANQSSKVYGFDGKSSFFK